MMDGPRAAAPVRDEKEGIAPLSPALEPPPLPPTALDEPAAPAPSDRVSAVQLRADRDAWDRFVTQTPLGTYPQLSAWADANAGKGWRDVRVVADSAEGPIGAQILVHRMRPGPWTRGYATRGPLAERYTDEGVRAFTEQLRRDARRLRMTHVFADPELPKGDPTGDLLVAAGWRRVPTVQPNQTRVVDLTPSEADLWSGLRSSARWSVNKSRRNGIMIEEAREDGLADLARLYDETATRAGFRRRADFTSVFRAFDARGWASIVLARDPSGTAVAALMLLVCGPRIIELYGASSTAGGKARANYLIKWEAMRRCRERGYTSYDMWGTDEPWIAEFKAGFGGEERFYDGAFELVTDKIGWFVLSAVRRARGFDWRYGRPVQDQPEG